MIPGAVTQQQQDGHARQALDQRHKPFFRGRIDPVHVLHFEEQRTLVTGVELHLKQGFKDPRAQGLGTERGQVLGAVVSPQHAEDVRTPCLRLHLDVP